MLNIYTGRNRLLSQALLTCVQESTEETVIVVVPKQLTLATEQFLLDGLHLQGSFRIQVLSAERFCARIFDFAGAPNGARIDDRGRVMLVRAAIHASEKYLTVYHGAEHRRGFAQRTAQQLERFRQAQISPDLLRESAADENGAARLKFNDLASILEQYELLIEDRYLDGAGEFLAAAERAVNAGFLSECSVWFYGFDMMPPALHQLIAAVGRMSARAGVFLPLENDKNAPDAYVFDPINDVFSQIVKAANSHGCAVERIQIREISEQNASTNPVGGTIFVAGADRKPALRHLEYGLFSTQLRAETDPANCIHLTLLRNPQEECRFAAALTRRLAQTRGWRWNDIAVLVRDPEGYATPLKNAFAEYDIPIFLPSQRPAARHAVAEYLLTALRAVEKNYPPDDMFALMHTGMSPLNDSEAERFTNYAIRYGLRGARFQRTLTRGLEAERAEMEPLRARLMAPLADLKSRLRKSETLYEQMTSLVRFLEESGAYAKNEARIQALVNAGMRETAGEEAQVWNRIMGTMDQMYALMGEKKLSLREIGDTLTESLSAAVIHTLPQSADAVHAQSTDAACFREAKAVIVIGMSDRAGGGTDGLLTPAQKHSLSRKLHRYLGPDDAEIALLNRFYLKAGLGMATEYASISCPLSGTDGASQRQSAIFNAVCALFPSLSIRGITDDASIERMLRSAPRAAVSLAAAALSAEGEGVPMSAVDCASLAELQILSTNSQTEAGAIAKTGLKCLYSALNRNAAADQLSPAVARDLYGALKTQSITRLERFAACPYAYFMQYGIRPERVDPFELRASDEGSFFHNAVHEFLLKSMQDLNALDAAQAIARMDAISDALLETLAESGPLGDSAVTLAERRRLKSTMRTVAVTLSEHMRGSLFHTSALEQYFGPEDDACALQLEDNCALEGRIDRIDAWDGPEKYLRIIDYKRGGKNIKLSTIYHGIQLQLPVYMAAALSKYGGLSGGMYYLALDEGIFTTQSTDKNEIERDRRALTRMEGLVPTSEAVQNALSADLKDVIKSGRTKAEREDYEAIMQCALRRANGYIRKIRSGVCAAAPVRYESYNPCTYCNVEVTCPEDSKTVLEHIRRKQSMETVEALLRMKAEQKGASSTEE